MPLLPVWPADKTALMALSVLDSVVNSSDANDRLVKAMDELGISEHSKTKVNQVLF